MSHFYRKRRVSDLPEPPERTPRTDWARVANLLTQEHRAHPGRWVLIQANAKDNRLASPSYLKRVLPFRVESFARETGPKILARKTGWEIWLRKPPQKTRAEFLADEAKRLNAEREASQVRELREAVHQQKEEA